MSCGFHTELLKIPETSLVAKSLGQERSSVLPMFHSLTGCDIVSFFGGSGKKTAWDTWNVFQGLTSALQALIALPDKIDATCMAVIEQFVILLYNRRSNLIKQHSWSQTRVIFQKGKVDRQFNIPPTNAALEQHVKRTVFQGGFIWSQTLLKQPILPSPSRWGWQLENGCFVPHWTTRTQAKDSCYELIRCVCKTGCRGRCKCLKASLSCTSLCNCGGNCS